VCEAWFPSVCCGVLRGKTVHKRTRVNYFCLSRSSSSTKKNTRRYYIYQNYITVIDTTRHHTHEMAAKSKEGCDTPACSSKDDMMRMMRAVVRERAKLGENQAASSTEKARDEKNDGAGAKIQEAMDESEERRILDATIATCPLSREDLGTGTWGLLHTIAANFPEKPTTVQKVQARRFFDALGDLYPCAVCKEDFRRDIDEHPPDVSSREALSVWVCERHNEVNAKLGKPTLDCVLKTLDKRWKNGGERCGGATPSE
jgi:FAD-linked sulfhydryl oxidase